MLSPLRRAAVAVTGAATVVLALAVPATAADTTPPTVSSFSVSAAGQTVTPNTPITISYTVADDTGATDLHFVYDDRFGDQIDFREFVNGTTPIPSTGTIQMSVGASWFNGPYTLSQIRVYDAADNETSYERGAHNNPFDFSSDDFAVSGSTQDDHAPGLEKLEYSGGTVKAGDTLSFPYADDGTDPAQPYTSMSLGFTGPGGQVESLVGVTSSPLTASLPSDTPPGHYTLTSVLVIDRKQWTTTYDASGGDPTTFPAQADNPGPAPFDLSTIAFDVVAAPSAPTAARATAHDGAATVTWAAATEHGSPVTGYTVTAAPGGRSVHVGPAARSASVTGLTDGTAYRFTVSAASAAGTSAPSTASAAVTPFGKPGAPGRPKAKVSGTRATVTWTASAARGAAVRYAVKVTGPTKKQPHTTATHSTLSGLKPGRYTVVVTATNKAGSTTSAKTTFTVKKKK